MLQRYIGNRAFYRRVTAIALPIVIQNTITNLVSLLDNVMVGWADPLQMSGTAIVNQLLFIFILCIYGTNAGAGIFTAQFHGNQDMDGIRHSFRFKLLSSLLMTGLGCAVLLLAEQPLISLYLQGEGDAADAAAVLGHAKDYLHIMLWGLLPFALSNAYSSTLRETGQTVVPMIGSITSVVVNLCLNFVLIFGYLGFPAMGARGAALATVIARFAELAVVAGWTHLNPQKNPYIRGMFRSMYVPFRLLRRIIGKAVPLMLNEGLFATGLAFANQSYSTCGLDVVPALNIAATMFNLSGVAYMALGNAIGIIMGQMMGAGTSRDEIKDANRKLCALTLVCGVVFGIATGLLSPVFPRFFGVPDSVCQVAAGLILIDALMIPAYAYVHVAYFSLRSGGKTGITFLFDCGFIWMLYVPAAFFLSRFTDLNIVPLYLICQSTEYVKAFAGYLMVRKSTWIQNLTVQRNK